MVGVLHFYNPTCACNHPYNLHQKSIPSLQTVFNFLFHHYLFAKLSLQSPRRLYSSKRQQLFTSKQSTPKIFSLPQPFSQCRLRQGNRKLECLVMTNTVVISSFCLKVWTVITELTTTEFV